jgi:hypothetical protein
MGPGEIIAFGIQLTVKELRQQYKAFAFNRRQAFSNRKMALGYSCFKIVKHKKHKTLNL